MSSSEYLSQCAECSSANAADWVTGTTIARCIQCGKSFLVSETRTISGANEQDFQLQKAVQEAGVATTSQAEKHRTWMAAGTSLLFNATMLLLLAMLFAFASSPRDQPIVLTGQLSEFPDDEFAMLPDFEIGGATSSDAVMQPTITVVDIPVTDLGAINVSDSELPDAIEDLAAGHGNGHGQGSGNGNGNGSGNGTVLFRGIADVESVAYVVDASGSMEGRRMHQVVAELRKSVNSLQQDQLFFIVFFNERTYPMMWPRIEKRLVPADRTNRMRVLRWAARVQPKESTLPEQALRMALALNPDVVFFLTDGDIPEGSLRIVKKYRHETTSVNTICVGQDAAVDVLQKIAAAGQGEFLMVQ